MLKQIFFVEIGAVTGQNFTYTAIAVVGFFLGILYYSMVVRRPSEFKGRLTGLVVLWAFLHLLTYINIGGFGGIIMKIPGIARVTMYSAMLASLGPVISFMFIGFGLKHLYTKWQWRK